MTDTHPVSPSDQPSAGGYALHNNANGNTEYGDLPPVVSYTNINTERPLIVNTAPAPPSLTSTSTSTSTATEEMPPRVTFVPAITTTQPGPPTVPMSQSQSNSTSNPQPSPSNAANDLPIPKTRNRSGSTATTNTTDSTWTVSSGESCVKEKRIKEWRKHFDTDEEERLVCTHGCALVVQIMIHGRMYLTNKNVYFRANILGIVTKRQIPIESITSILPRNVAGSIPNAIEILFTPPSIPSSNSTTSLSPESDGSDENRALFTTLPQRDHTLGILVDQWRSGRGGTYEAFLKSEAGEGLRGYVPGTDQGKIGANVNSNAAVGGGAGYESDSSSSSTTHAGSHPDPAKPTPSSSSSGKQAGGGSSGPDSSTTGPHPATQADTPDLEKQALHTRLPSEPKRVYELLYHKPEFLEGIWKGEGMKDIHVEPWQNNKRTFDYSRPLGGKFGSTHCESEETILQPSEKGDWWGVEGTTRTPGVPAGKSFLTRSKTTFTYAEGGGTVMHVTYQVEWTGKSMLKSTINKQAETGQQSWNSLLAKELKKYIKEHPEEFPKTGNDEGVDEDEEAIEAASKSDGPRVPSTTTRGKGASPTTTSNPSSSDSDEFDPIGWITDDPLRAAISAVLITIILLYAWGLIKGLFVGQTVRISKKRLVALEAIEKQFLAGLSAGTGAGGQVGREEVGGVATETIIKKIVRPRTTG